MSFLGSLTDEGLAARRGIITLLGAAGWALAWFWKEHGEPDYLRLLAGLACIAVSIGLWLNVRWARWLALGTCYLAILAAFVMPVVVALRPQVNADGEHATGVELFICGAAAAIAVVAYKGLAYYRSPAAWLAFSSDDKQRTALAEESSLQVLVSAVFVATLLGFLAMVRAAATPAAESNPKKGSATKRPDLVISSLCMSGTNLIQAEVRNIGLGSASGKYYIEYTSLRGGMAADRVEQSFGEVPQPGKSTYVVLNTAGNITEEEGVRHPVRLEVDYTHKIRESNEDNNRASFTIIFNYHHPANLPRCPWAPGLRNSSEVSAPAPAPEPATAPAPATAMPPTQAPGQPDLVFNSLCKDRENMVRAEVQNRGDGISTRRYLVTITSMHGASRTRHSWGEGPAPGQSTWIPLNRSIERGGIYKVKDIELMVDSKGYVGESNEDNNRVFLTNITRDGYTYGRADGESTYLPMNSCNVEAS